MTLRCEGVGRRGEKEEEKKDGGTPYKTRNPLRMSGITWFFLEHEACNVFVLED